VQNREEGGILNNRIDLTFERLRAERKKGFIAYITGGDPDLDRTLVVAHALERAGVDLLEIGLPFSDPLADGVANQLSAQRALEAGTNIPKLFAAIRQFRTTSELPIVLYSYLNPVFNYGFEKFHNEAREAGIDGLLLLDLPPDEALRNDGLADSRIETNRFSRTDDAAGAHRKSHRAGCGICVLRFARRSYG
jgi:tryptophan synthase alpha chain